MEAIRLGVVGPGLIWRNAHQRIIEKRKDAFRISAFCASSESTRKRVKAEYPQAAIFDNYEELVASPAVDCVLVLTPIALNAVVTLAALRAGKDVLVEKPFATNSEDCRKILAESRHSGRKVVVLEQERYSPRYRALRDLLQSKAVGEIVLWDKLNHFVLGDVGDVSQGYGNTEWRRKADFPLGPLMDGGIHDIALLSGLFGPPRALVARGKKCRPGFGEYDSISVMMTYSENRVGMLNHSGYLLPDANYFNIRGTEGLIVVGEKLALHTRGGKTREIALGKATDYESMWLAIEDVFARGSPSPYPLEEAAKDIATCEAIGRSIKTEREERLSD
jgi:predicted dehydrogenase